MVKFYGICHNQGCKFSAKIESGKFSGNFPTYKHTYCWLLEVAVTALPPPPKGSTKIPLNADIDIFEQCHIVKKYGIMTFPLLSCSLILRSLLGHI